MKTASKVFAFNTLCSPQMMQNYTGLQRSFSDNALQNNWCLNLNLTTKLHTMYQPYCASPLATIVAPKKSKMRRNSFTGPRRPLSAGDVSEATENYVANVRAEQHRLRNFRHWQSTNFGKQLGGQSKSTGLIFTLMSYNVLAQILLTDHSYLYRKHDARALYWNHRKWALMREFEEHNADIMCLQEVEKTHLDSFYSKLNGLGYKGIYKKRTGAMIDGCALYYKSDKFNLVEYTTVEYFQPDFEILNRENVGIVARFNDKANPENEFVVATTHLLFNPRRQDVRLAQTQLLLAEVDRIAFKTVDEQNQPVYLPIIITGDFNLEPYTPVYELLVNGELVYQNLTRRRLQKPNHSQHYTSLTGPVLLPSLLRITDHCQHADIAVRRHRGSNYNRNRKLEMDLIKLYHSDRVKSIENLPRDSGNLTASKHLFSTGTLTHGLNLRSVYQHNRGNDTEATTHQDKWISVDYIFYSARDDDRSRYDVEEASLQLLSKYKLPSSTDCKKLPTIPNLVFGSDHLALVAKFLLK